MDKIWNTFYLIDICLLCVKFFWNKPEREILKILHEIVLL